MIARIKEAIRRDILDARTAWEYKQYRMMLPGWLYGKTFGRRD